MWVHEYSSTTDVDRDRLWQVLADVAGWERWNDGVAGIELHGPVAVGSSFTMRMPDGSALQSTIAELEPGRVITDLTELDDIAVRVQHRLDAGEGPTTITYRIEVSGSVPEEVAEQVGNQVSADFPEVVDALVATSRQASRDAG